MDASRLDDHYQRPASRVTPAQVIALGLVAISIGWAAWFLRDRPINEEVELLPGTVLPSSELAIVEAAFDRAQRIALRTAASGCRGRGRAPTCGRWSTRRRCRVSLVAA